MLRENLYSLMEKGEKTLFVPKNGGLNDYVMNLLPEIGVPKRAVRTLTDGASKTRTGNLELIVVRGEDIPQRVFELNARGNLAYGLSGDDLYDEFIMSRGGVAQGKGFELSDVNTYDWFDPAAEYSRPALCFMNGTGNIKDVKSGARIAVNAKYWLTSEQYLEDKLGSRGIRFTTTKYHGGTEETVWDKTNTACVEIVYGGSSRKENGLKVIDPVRFSDIVLIGPKYTGVEKMPKNTMALEYAKIVQRLKSPRKGSLTTQMANDLNELRKKAGSEFAEWVDATTTGKNLVGESCDMFYPIMVALAIKGYRWNQVERALMKRW